MNTITLGIDGVDVDVVVGLLAPLAGLPGAKVTTTVGTLEVSWPSPPDGEAATLRPLALPAAVEDPPAPVALRAPTRKRAAGRAELTCDECGDTFRTAGGLGSHRTSRHPSTRPALPATPTPALPATPTPALAGTPAPHRCADCDRRFSSLQALGVHRTRSHPTTKGVLAAGPIEGSPKPGPGESGDDLEARRRAAAAAAL